jgi:hypothetical protein
LVRQSLQLVSSRSSDYKGGQALKGRRFKLGDTHPHTIESLNNLIDLYEASNKPEKANEWRLKLPQMEAETE